MFIQTGDPIIFHWIFQLTKTFAPINRGQELLEWKGTGLNSIQGEKMT